MNKERILNPTVVAAVALLHVGLMSLLWRAHVPPPVEVEHIEFVDLGDSVAETGMPKEQVRPPPRRIPLRFSRNRSRRNPSLNLKK